jgi:neutral amino acid transport system permease protein
MRIRDFPGFGDFPNAPASGTIKGCIPSRETLGEPWACISMENLTDTLDKVPQLIANGAFLGCIVAIAAVGLTLVFGILRLSNFAHGDYMTWGGYLTLMFDRGLNRVMAVDSANLGLAMVRVGVAMLLSTLVMIGYSLLCERLLWRPMRAKRASSTTLVILSIGLALFMRNAVLLIWGQGAEDYQLPVLAGKQLSILGANVTIEIFDILTLGLTLAVLGLMHYLLQNTKIGKAMRAVADDIDLARVTGINVDRVVIWTWVIAGGVTALSGSLLGLVEAVKPDMGWFLILPLFAAVIVGGIGNPYGAIAGAFLISILQELSTLIIPFQYKTAIALLVMMTVLLIRPQGLFRGTM